MLVRFVGGLDTSDWRRRYGSLWIANLFAELILNEPAANSGPEDVPLWRAERHILLAATCAQLEGRPGTVRDSRKFGCAFLVGCAPAV